MATKTAQSNPQKPFLDHRWTIGMATAPIPPAYWNESAGSRQRSSIDFFSLFNQRAAGWASLEPENSLEPTPTAWLAADLRFWLRAQFGRANRNLSTCAPENS